MADFNEDLQAALELADEREGASTALVPEGWRQGRGTFGGLVMGLLERAMERREPPGERALRSFSGEILAPVQPGPAQIEVEVLRPGRGITSVSARLRQEGALLAHATGMMARARVADREAVQLERPHPPGWSSVPIMAIPPAFAPPFIRAFELRLVSPMPFSGSTDPLVEGWVRLRHPPLRMGAAELMACIDAYWPIAFALETVPRPTATVAFTYQRCIDPGALDPAEPLFYRARGASSHEGFAVEVRELWTPDGRLVALNPQTFAIIR